MKNKVFATWKTNCSQHGEQSVHAYGTVCFNGWNKLFRQGEQLVPTVETPFTPHAESGRKPILFVLFSAGNSMI